MVESMWPDEGSPSAPGVTLRGLPGLVERDPCPGHRRSPGRVRRSAPGSRRHRLPRLLCLLLRRCRRSAQPPRVERPRLSQGLSLTPSSVELRDGDAVALSNDLAARDLRLVGNRLGEVLVGDPLRDELRGLGVLLGRLEETERAQDAVVGLDQVVALEAGELAELRDERLLDLAGDLVRAGHVDTFVTTDGGMHVMLLLLLLQDRAPE